MYQSIKKHRKLVAIMFTDIVGYTAMMSKNEHKALQILKKNRDVTKLLVSQFNGEWLKEMGDGTLSSFDSVVNAVNCALEIQNSFRDEYEFKLRIGIHIGDVVVEEGDVFGDGVNVASRIENMAEPGGISISERVYIDIQNKPEITAVLIGEKKLKNVPRPIKIYSISRASEPVHVTKPSVSEKYYIIKDKPSIAVLPFQNMSADKEQEYFCEGMAEEIINALAHVEGLLVVARTSSFAFKDKHEDIREIGKKLNVNTILEGSVRKAGNQLRITAQLIKVEDSYHLFSEQFDRGIEDVFAIQDEISLAIAEKLKVKLLSKEKAAIVKRYTKNIDAYNSYLLGRHYWNKRTEEGFYKAIEYFNVAIEKDPKYALAYAGLADSYSLLTTYSNFPSIEAYDKAKDAALKALDIDDTLAEAHASLAGIKMDFEWDWAGTVSEFKKAINLNPGYASAHQWFASLLVMLGRFDEAIKVIKRANELDPISIIIYYVKSQIYRYSGRYNDAMENFLKAQEMDPNFWLLHYGIGTLQCEKGNFKEAVSSLKKANRFSEDLFFTRSALGYVYGISGDKDKAKKILKKLLEHKKKEKVSSYLLALLNLGLGKYDEVYECLEKAYEERDTLMTYIKVEPEFKILHSKPRFKKLLKKMGLEE